METKKFNAYDRVLIKDSDGIWQIDFYSYQDSDDLHHVMTYGESNSFVDTDILPYEGNEYLVGTDLPADEEVRLEEGEWVMVCDDIDLENPQFWSFARIVDPIHNGYFMCNYCTIKYAVKFSDFNPNDMEETKKHILCVKNGKIVKYKG